MTLSVASQEDCGGYSYSDYDMNSGNQGNMWDVVAVNPITITSVGFNFNGCAGSSQTIRLYKRIDFGTHADVEFNSSAWEVIFDGTISCSGWAPTSTIIGIDVFIPQGERQAFYLHGVSRGLVADWQAGEVGDLHYSNEDLEVYVGSPLPGYFDDGYSGASAAPSMGMGYCIGSNSDGWTDYDSPVSISTNDDSWNLLGNPYGYSLSIQQLAIDNSGHGPVYIWDSAADAYKNHNGIAGDIADGLIAPFQGFFSEATAGATSYTFTESSISNGTGTNYRTTTDVTPGSAIFSFHVGDYTSSLYLSFDPNGHINLDNADALRLLPLEPVSHLTSMIHESSKSLSINNLPLDLSTDISMDMDVMMLNPTDDGYATQAEQVNLTWDITNLPEGITLVLRNNITGQNINLTGYPSANINLPSKGSFLTSGDFMATYPVVGQSQFTLSIYGTLAAAEDDNILPERLTLHSAYPNPFNPSTVISFDLPDAEMVSLEIFDIAGRQVASLISEYMIPGSHQINWNPGNLSSGIYLVNLVVGTETLNQKITFIK